MEKENIGFNKNGLSREEVEIAYEKTIFYVYDTALGSYVVWMF